MYQALFLRAGYRYQARATRCTNCASLITGTSVQPLYGTGSDGKLGGAWERRGCGPQSLRKVLRQNFNAVLRYRLWLRLYCEPDVASSLPLLDGHGHQILPYITPPLSISTRRLKLGERSTYVVTNCVLHLGATMH